MEFIVMSLQFVVNFAWMLILMYSAFEAALYILSMVHAITTSYIEHGFAQPMAQLKAAHAHALSNRKAFKYALV